MRSVEELRKLERLYVASLHQKESELRNVIGNHIPDVCASARGLGEMQQTAIAVAAETERIAKSVEKLEGVQLEYVPPRIPAPRNFDLMHQLAFACDAPEVVSSASEKGDVFPALDVLLAAEELFDRLSEVSAPLLRRQFRVVGGLRPLVSRACHRRLLDPSASEKDCVHALIGVRVLDHQPPPQLLEVFLQSRTAWLSALDVVPVPVVSTSVPPGTIAMLRALWVLRQTATHTAALFIPAPGSTTTAATAAAAATGAVAGASPAFDFASARPLLPSPALSVDSIAHHTAAPAAAVGGGLGTAAAAAMRAAELSWRVGAGLDEQTVRSAAVQWLDAFSQQMLIMAAGELSNVSTADTLVAVEDALCQFAAEQEDGAWDQLCVRVFGRVVRSWALLSGVFWDRARELARARFAALPVAALLQQALTATTAEGGVHLSLTASVQAGDARFGFAPAAAPFLTALDKHAVGAMEDARILVAERSQANYDRRKRYRAPFSEIADAARTGAADLVDALTETLTTSLPASATPADVPAAASAAIAATVDALNDAQADKVLLLAHIAAGAVASSELHRALSTAGTTAAAATDTLLTAARTKLRAVTRECGRVWGSWLAARLHAADGFGSDTATETWDVALVGGEELRVPAQPQQSVASMLFALTRKWTHAAPLAAVEDMRAAAFHAVCESVVTGVQRLLSAQSASGDTSNTLLLQTLFDLNVIYGLLCESRPTSALVGGLIADVQQKIDPIDMAVYAPEISARVQRYISQCALLFGALSRTAIKTAQTAAVQQGSSSAPVVAEPPPRFALLPVSIPGRSLTPTTEASGRAKKKRVSPFAPVKGGTGAAASAGTPTAAPVAAAATAGSRMGSLGVNAVKEQLGLSFLDSVFQ